MNEERSALEALKASIDKQNRLQEETNNLLQALMIGLLDKGERDPNADGAKQREHDPKRSGLSEERAHDLAWQIAMLELLRRIVAEAFFHADPAEFRRRMKTLESVTVDELRDRRFFPDKPEAAENFIKETAASVITGILTSIRHPNDSRGDGA